MWVQFIILHQITNPKKQTPCTYGKTFAATGLIYDCSVISFSNCNSPNKIRYYGWCRKNIFI